MKPLIVDYPTPVEKKCSLFSSLEECWLLCLLLANVNYLCKVFKLLGLKGLVLKDNLYFEEIISAGSKTEHPPF